MSEYKPFGLLAELFKQPNNRQPNDKQAMRRAFNYTLEFNECAKCGATWTPDEDDTCENCD